MAEHSRTLHYQRESQTSGVRLYTTQGEVTSPTVITAGNVVNEGTLSTTAADDITPALRLNDGSTTVYAKLGSTSDSSASSMRVNVNGTTYAVFKEVLPEKGKSSYTPEEIKEIVNAGKHTEYFNVGDSILSITLNGTIEGTTFTNQTIKAKILGFDHNKATETNGKSSITFGIADTEGTDIALLAAKMNSSDTNPGGWNGSYMRNTVCNALYNALPSDLKSVIGSVTKYTDNTGGGNNIASYVTTTKDKIFLLSEYEVFGTRPYANSVEQNYQQQYDYYKDGASKIRYLSGSAGAWWLRSVKRDNSHYFCAVGAPGDVGYGAANAAYGFVPCFAIVAD